MTADFDANNDDASVGDSEGSSVPYTLMVNSNPAKSKYGCMYRCTIQYDPVTGCTIGTEAIALANYHQCLEETDGKMEFANVGAGIGGGFENIMELKPMKHKEAIKQPDEEAWAKEIEKT